MSPKQKMKDEKFEDYEDYPLRIFLLTLLDGHEYSFIDVKRAVKQEFYRRNLTGQRIRGIVNKLVRYNCISKQKREKPDENDCIYIYTINNRGRERLKYYSKKLKEKK